MCILLVEDEPLILECVAEGLADAGLEVTTAMDGRSAIRLIEQPGTHFTALVTDLHMPGCLDGTHVVDSMLRHHPAAPIVIATARQDLLTPQWRNRTGARVLAKPYGIAGLVALIQVLLNQPS